MRAALPVFLLIPYCVWSASLSGQVVFSRRVYQSRGTSYQQIWTWNPASGVLQALTGSSRNHYLPACAGAKLTFVSPEKYAGNAAEWSFDPSTGDEHQVGPAAGPPLRPEASPHNGCDRTAKAGAVEACAAREELTLSRAGKPIARFHLQVNECSDARGGTHGPCATPILSLEWSADGKWLLVGELGRDTNSTAPQFDYYVVDAAGLHLQKVASAEQYSAQWLPGRDRLLYVTPRDLAQLPGASKRTVWVQHLGVFDPVTGTSKGITSGLTNNLDPVVCRQ